MKSKSEVAEMYGIHRSTLAKWVQLLTDKAKQLSKDRQDDSYLSFLEYNKNSRTFTPLQVQCIKKHFGDPDI